MSTRYEIRQQVCNVNGCRLEVVASGEFERPVRMSYESWKTEHPLAYFELVAVTVNEECLEFTAHRGAAASMALPGQQAHNREQQG